MRAHKLSHSSRVFLIGDPNTPAYFISNNVRTSKYTKLSFLPLAILYQFERLANIYFLITAILLNFNAISSLSPLSAALPFFFVIGLSVIREGFEDLPRQKSDKMVNASPAAYLSRENKIEATTWADLKVGQIVALQEGEEIPADMILLATSNENGIAYIETTSLDGEKNLKPKYTMPAVCPYFNHKSVENVNLYQCKIHAQPPDSLLYKFEGWFEAEDEQKSPIQAKQLLLRGSKLRNTEWAFGAVVYTGYDTKIMRNTELRKNKQSKLESLTNKLLLAILGTQFICCLAAGLISYFWADNHLLNEVTGNGHWYLNQNGHRPLNILFIFLSYFVLTNTMIPISLIVTIEIVKFAQAKFIEQDDDMYNPENGEATQVFSSTMNEELGLVEYIFTDKTGTLTSNNMIFRNFVIGEEVYGEHRPKLYSGPKKEDPDFYVKEGYQAQQDQTTNSSITLFRDQACAAIQTEQPLEPEGPIFNDPVNGGLGLKTQKDLILEFMQAVVICHDCLVEPNDNGVYIYQGQSQDEIRLIEAARDAGFVYTGGNLKRLRISMLKKMKDVEMLQLFEFNSDRKRMSVIVRDKDSIKMYTKGADNIIFDRLNKQVKQPFYETIEKKLEEYSKCGYRTLVYAMRVVSEEEYQGLIDKMNSVAGLDNFEERINLIADDFERGLHLIGCSTVEDKLQRNTPEVIDQLLKAGIKIWMATGDKLHTAENIAFSCRLIKGDTTIMRCVGTSYEEVYAKLLENKEIYEVCLRDHRKMAFIVQGDALAFILDNAWLKELFTDITLQCDAVVCCRATPRQKADLVRLVENRTKKVTLAIGDGANDVSMIQAANIGIGLFGQEGLQAVQASDYAVSEFQSLWRLILVHGRWSYIRIAEMILYFFYKNMLFTVPQLFFGIHCAFSGQTIWEDYYIAGYNLVFTNLPLVVKAILDQDINYKRVRRSRPDEPPGIQIEEDLSIKERFPALYKQNKENLIFTLESFFAWVLEGVIVAALLYFLGLYMLDGMITSPNGHTGGLWYFSIAQYTAVIMVVNMKLALYTRTWTALFCFALFGTSIAVYIVFIIVYDMFNSSVARFTIGLNAQSVQFYAFFILFTGITLVVDLTKNLIFNAYSQPITVQLRLSTNWEKRFRRTERVSNNPKVAELDSFIKVPRRSLHSRSLALNAYHNPYI